MVLVWCLSLCSHRSKETVGAGLLSLAGIPEIAFIPAAGVFQWGALATSKRCHRRRGSRARRCRTRWREASRWSVRASIAAVRWSPDRRERTASTVRRGVGSPSRTMRVGRRLQLTGVSLSDTIFILDNSGVYRCRSAVNNGGAEGRPPARQRYRSGSGRRRRDRELTRRPMRVVFAAVDRATNRLRHVRLYPTRTAANFQMFMAEVRENQCMGDALVLVDVVPWLKALSFPPWAAIPHETHGDRNSIKHIYFEVKQRTNQF